MVFELRLTYQNPNLFILLEITEEQRSDQIRSVYDRAQNILGSLTMGMSTKVLESG